MMRLKGKSEIKEIAEELGFKVYVYEENAVVLNASTAEIIQLTSLLEYFLEHLSE